MEHVGDLLTIYNGWKSHCSAIIFRQMEQERHGYNEIIHNLQQENVRLTDENRRVIVQLQREVNLVSLV